jgi:uncharacterized repeat protein (TIGR03803 family)
VLWSFCSATNCTDGSAPTGALVADSAGNLYGTTLFGGENNLGEVFELIKPTSGGAWTQVVLYSFSGAPTGANPYSALVFDSSGNLYGTTNTGGVASCSTCGVAFELSPPTGGSGPWTESVIYSFGNTTPFGPESGMIFDAKGNLYGVVPGGGGSSDGFAYELSPPAGGTGPWTETVIQTFTGANGQYPVGSLIFDAKGNLYGTATADGANGNGGVVFELSPPSSGSGPWSEAVLYSFCSLAGCADGSTPYGTLVFDAKGNLYGTTYAGGASANPNGTVFEVSPPAGGTGTWTEKVLYSFCSVSGCTDGYEPLGGPVLDATGNLYATTFRGGSDGFGTVLELIPPAAGSTWTESILLSFNGSDGANPHFGSLIFDASGNLYGTGQNGPSGVVFELSPNTTTLLSSSQNPSDVGEVVKFTATVSGGLSPTGTVAFTSNGAIITGCGAVTLSSGAATCMTSFATAAAYAIEATYSGDSMNASSRGTLTQEVIVPPPTTTTVTSSVNPSTFGESVTLTATVTPAGPPTPTGTVTFTSNAAAISGCSAVTLSSSRTAACTTTTLPVGTDAIVATYSGDSNYAGSTGTFAQLVNPIPTPVQFFSVTPCRIVDTRGADGPLGGPELTAGETRSFTIPSGPCAGIPSTAVAYSLNVTVVPPGPLGYLTIWPAGEGQPTVSTLNSLDGRVKANAAIVPAGTSGAVSVYVNNATNVLLDIDGYFAASSSSSLEFYPLTPCRIADTRKSSGYATGLGAPSLVADTERNFPIMSASGNTVPCAIPSTAKAYSLNFTAIPPSGGDLGYLTVWPQGETKPVVSTLNDLTGTIVANAALVPAGTDGGVAVYPSNDTDLVIDINGYFAVAGTGGLQLYALTPCRVLDTRKTSGTFTGALTVEVASSTCAPPSTAKGYVFNATVVPSGDLGYLTLWPDGESQPVVSTLNAADGDITSNMAIVPNSDGKTDAYASGTTQLVLDISAYFAP